MSQELTQKTKQNALNSGADLFGVVGVEDLAEHSEDIHKILPGAKMLEGDSQRWRASWSMASASGESRLRSQRKLRVTEPISIFPRDQAMSG